MTPSLSTGRLKLRMLVALVTFGCCGCGFLLYEANDGRLKWNWEGTLNPEVFVDSSGNKSKVYLLEVKRAPEGESLVKWGLLHLSTKQLAFQPARQLLSAVNQLRSWRVRRRATASATGSFSDERLRSINPPMRIPRQRWTSQRVSALSSFVKIRHLNKPSKSKRRNHETDYCSICY